MTILYWILGVIGIGLLGRYVPGFKCISYCRYKTIKKNMALKKLKSICDMDNGYRPKVITINSDGYSSKKLLALYKNTLQFGCNSFNEPEWIPSAREILKERIAELQLLEA